MSYIPQRRQGEKLGPWELLAILGAGGNAEVWRAIKEDGSVAAIKILKNRTPDSEPYKRFRDEIRVLRQLSGQYGILPLVDASLPISPSRQTPAWLAMPVAVPIKEALGSTRQLETVVEAITEIATTLALLSHQSISHRDIKPGNLYRYNDKWVVGDFGLVEYPGKEELTEATTQLGPRNYLAPEMISNPHTADGRPADVYSLAKTLWVLGSGQNFPPPGELRLEVVGLRLSSYVSHSQSYLLDRIIENATQHDPVNRLTMKEFAEELYLWLRPSNAVMPPDDLSDLAPKVIALMEPARRIVEQREKQKALAREAVEKLHTGLEHIVNLLNDSSVPNQGVRKDKTILERFKAKHAPTFGSPDRLWQDTYCIVIREPSNNETSLYCGVVAELLSDNTLHLAAAYILRDKFVVRSEEIWAESIDVKLGSINQEHVINELTRGLYDNLRPSLQRFTQFLEART